MKRYRKGRRVRRARKRNFFGFRSKKEFNFFYKGIGSKVLKKIIQTGNRKHWLLRVKKLMKTNPAKAKKVLEFNKETKKLLYPKLYPKATLASRFSGLLGMAVNFAKKVASQPYATPIMIALAGAATAYSAYKIFKRYYKKCGKTASGEPTFLYSRCNGGPKKCFTMKQIMAFEKTKIKNKK